MRTTGAIITDLIEQYHRHGRGWMRVTDLQGFTRDELTVAFEELLEDEDFQAEPQPFGHRITEADRQIAPIIGGEARHLIRWG
jgi:hypothetical protein